MSEHLNHAASGASLNSEEQRLLDEFLNENRLFYAPDPDIMRNHKLAPRSATEQRVLGGVLDDNIINLVRGRFNSALDEVFTMV